MSAAEHDALTPIYDASALTLTRLAGTVLIAMLSMPARNLAQAPAPQYKDSAALLASLPKAAVKPLDASAALFFAALPLTCIDDLQPRPMVTRPYFWQPTYRTVDSFAKTRAFFGCNDWPSAASAAWTLVTLLKKYPDIGSGQLIREKLSAHLGRENLEGELAYFRGAGNAQRPYGYAWFLRLYAELATWKDPDGARFAENAAPLARFFADGTVSYLVDLDRPNRAATQTNSAFVLNLLLDYVDATRDMTIKRAVTDTARRLFEADTDCTTRTEASSPEMVSPCLEEAALMSRTLTSAAFAVWFDKFMPPVEAEVFQPLRSISFDATGARGRGTGRGQAAATSGGGTTAPTPTATPAQTGIAGTPAAVPADTPGRGAPPTNGRGAQANPRMNWIALAFTRAAAFSRLAAAMPPGDARAAAYRRLADIHAENGQREVVTAAAFDAPWIGALAVSYLVSIGGAR